MEDPGIGINIMQDLQTHLQTANVPMNQLSKVAREGDEKLVEKFLSENVQIGGSGKDAQQSQLYIGAFWGYKDIVRRLLEVDTDVNYQNKETLWTPLHAACFQEHGPVVKLLLEHKADPELKDSGERTPKDFASASEKVWPLFAVLGQRRTPKSQLIDMGIIKKVTKPAIGDLSPRTTPHTPGEGIRMASYNRPESAYAYNSDPFMHAATSGDVLAEDDGGEQVGSGTGHQPQFTMWK